MPARFDVFLSHASTDKPLVEELARRLARENLKPWLDKWNLIPGTAWQPEIEAVLADCITCAVIIGAGGFGPWHHEEMRLAIGRRVENREHVFRVIPVLLPGVERPERSKLPGFLTATTWVEYRDTLDDPEAFHRLLCGIRGIGPEDRAGGAAFEGKNPYRGLELFDVGNAPLFFGREALTEWLLDALKRKPSAVENRFLTIVGASGSGKSSLARAGLLAALKDGKLDGSAAWPRAICRPGAEPFFNLAKAVTGLAPESVSAVVFDRLQGRKDGERSLHVAAGLALGEPPRAERLVVLVDQFEEVFTTCHDESERGAFIANFLHAATVVGGRTVVVLTMRADFYPRCASYADLAAALSDHQVLVGPMTEDELRRAIDRPARLAGLEPEAGLVELLVDDIRGRAGALPLLQFALQEVWRRRDDYRLTIRTYREIGQIEGALQLPVIEAPDLHDGPPPLVQVAWPARDRPIDHPLPIRGQHLEDALGGHRRDVVGERPDPPGLLHRPADVVHHAPAGRNAFRGSSAGQFDEELLQPGPVDAVIPHPPEMHADRRGGVGAEEFRGAAVGMGEPGREVECRRVVLAHVGPHLEGERLGGDAPGVAAPMSPSQVGGIPRAAEPALIPAHGLPPHRRRRHDGGRLLGGGVARTRRVDQAGHQGDHPAHARIQASHVNSPGSCIVTNRPRGRRPARRLRERPRGRG